ncbi:MAG: RIP metalloprotease RseP [Bacteroidales bacterium]|jgi:regulator of sigma E protease|nr:RIP metalloprotease RseP [Bacteroidales bacterium]
MQALQLIVSLSILVLIHELGHFTFAKLFGTRVDKFYLFFNPKISLVKCKKINGKWRFKFFSQNVDDDDWEKYPDNTEYGIGWLPFGGYCKIAGMIDESMDKNHLEQEPKDYEYRSKKLWQRFLIISGGVIFNFIFALIIYAGMLYAWGESYLPVKNAHYGIYVDSTARSLGLHNGDKILSIDGIEPERFSDIIMAIVVDEAQTVRIDRNGQELDIAIPEKFNRKIISNSNATFITEFIPFIIDSLIPQSPAEKAGLRIGDRVVGIDSIETPAFYDFVLAVKSYAGKNTNLIVERNGYRETVPVTISEQGTIGAYRRDLPDIYTFETKSYTLLQSIPAGACLGVETLGFYVKQMKLVFTKEGSQEVGSFVSMGKLYPKTWNWAAFWSLMALFSIILAFMNILPIPALDGGHLLFLIYELIFGKKPSDQFLVKAQMVGMAIVLSIFFYALFLDLGRLF